METKNYQEELSTIRKILTSNDKYGKPLAIGNQPNHTIKVNPNLEPALLITLLNYISKLCDPDEDCMSITTTEFAEYAYANDKVNEYNFFIRQVNALTSKTGGLAMYKMAKEQKRELIFPDFIYYFGEVSKYKDTDDISKEVKIKFYKDFVATFNECIVKNEIIVKRNLETNKKEEKK